MSPTRERRMSTHLSRVTLVELVDDALERLHFVVQSPLLLVHERLHVDRRRLPVVVFQFHFFLQTLRHDRHRQILHRDKRNIAVTVGNNRLMGTANYSFTSNNMTWNHWISLLIFLMKLFRSNNTGIIQNVLGTFNSTCQVKKQKNEKQIRKKTITDSF